MPRPARRRLVPAVLSIALLGAGIAAPASRAAAPDDALVPSPAERTPTTGRRGTIDVAQLPEVTGAPGGDRAAFRAPSPFPSVTTGASGARGTADTTVGLSPVSITTAPPAARPGFAAIDSSDDGGLPIDSTVAAGPDHVVQVVGATVGIWSRSGGTKVAPTAIAIQEFFDLPGQYVNDGARVIYDALHGRFVMSELSWSCDDDGNGTSDDPTGAVDFLVSRTADPTGIWDRYSIIWDGYFPDSPAIGTSTDKLAIGANLYEMPATEDCLSGLGYRQVALTFLDWTDVLSSLAPGGDASIDIFSASLEDAGDFTAYFAAQFAVQTPATSPVLHLVVQHYDGAILSPTYAKITGTVAADTIIAPYQADLTLEHAILSPMVDPPAPLQPGGTTVADPIDSRPTSAIWQANRLTWTSNHGCQPATDTLVRSCVRVSQIATGGATTAAPTLVQDFLVSEKGAYAYAGGIGQSLDGTLFVAWTRSANASGGQPRSVAAYQRPADGTYQLSPSELLLRGSGSAVTEGLWAQSTGIGQDPQVPNAVWAAHLAATGGTAWATKVAQLQTGGATYVPIAPLRVLDSRVGTGVSGTFKSGLPRAFAVAGFSGTGGSIPADAIAVTGNVTVVGQTGPGYVAITPTTTATPRSSTINFPTGDVRANNATVSLSPDGDLAAVYKSTSGKTSHVLFDVTGYFLPGPEDAVYATLPPTRFLDSRAGKAIGLSGRFSTSVPRKLDVAGIKGVPADAVAITANLTVVNQTKAGYVSVTPTSQPTPTTSTLNFPTGDVRANGLTVKLGGGDVWLVYKAGAGATTDLILDVTGYYRPAGSGLRFYALEPGRIMDTRTSLLSGLEGRFSPSVPRRLDTDGHWGVPAGAKAITGNLTVTGQTGAGYVSVTPTSQANPTTSTLNFPLGDTRANGITVPLHTDGNQYLVYKASSGKRTHLILDVTGYFQ